MKTLDSKALIDALTRAIDFHRRQPASNIEVVIALTEVRDAVRYAINEAHLSPTGYPVKRMKSKRNNEN